MRVWRDGGVHARRTMGGRIFGVILAAYLAAVVCGRGERLVWGENPEEMKTATTAPTPVKVPVAVIKGIVARLEDDAFWVREGASAELAGLPAEAVGDLEGVVKGMELSPEAELRVEAALRVLRMKVRLSKHPVFTGADPEKIAISDDVITQIVPLVNISAERLRPDLAPLLSENAELDMMPGGGNSLVITDTSAKIHRLVEIIKKMDNQRVIRTQTEYRQMLNASAADAARLINAMFAPGSGGGGARVSGRLYADFDARTNTVIVNGPLEQVQQAREMLERLDNVVVEGRGATRGDAGGTTGRGAAGGVAEEAATGGAGK